MYRDIQAAFFLIIGLAMGMILAIMLHTSQPVQTMEDFTDTGVGCIDDCLDVR